MNCTFGLCRTSRYIEANHKTVRKVIPHEHLDTIEASEDSEDSGWVEEVIGEESHVALVV